MTGALASPGRGGVNFEELDQTAAQAFDEGFAKGQERVKEIGMIFRRPNALVEVMESMKPETLQGITAELLQKMGPERASEVIQAVKPMTGPWWKRMFGG
jgi:phage tail tape-measure protein